MNYKEQYYKDKGLYRCDVLLCAVCCNVAVNLHHVVYKSHGGSDDSSNLLPLCFKCHNSHHSQNTPTTEELKKLL